MVANNESDYLWKEGHLLANMRLLIEGAANLFENDAQPLARLAIDNNENEASIALDTIGTALTDLRTHIRTLQSEHMQEVVRQMKL